MKGTGNQQDYGMRIYDPRIGRFLSVDPLTKDYPMLTPYQFASNRPIDGIDLDGLEFMKYNDSYVWMAISYDPKLKKVSAVVVFRTNQKAIGTIFSQTILPGALNDYIMSNNESPNSIGSSAANVATLDIVFKSSLVKSADDASMEDVEILPTAAAPAEYRTAVNPKNIKEDRQMRKNREFFTKGVSANVEKGNAAAAAIDLVGKAFEKIGMYYVKSVVDEAKGPQTRNAEQVLVIIQEGINNKKISGRFLEPGELNSVANYLLFGKIPEKIVFVDGNATVVQDQEALDLGKSLWADYTNKSQQSSGSKEGGQVIKIK